MERVRVGVIGLGEVAQIIHLPILQALGDRFEIAAVCDVSPELLRVIGQVGARDLARVRLRRGGRCGTPGDRKHGDEDRNGSA